jgi:2-dehydropantoate 2-reductase
MGAVAKPTVGIIGTGAIGGFYGVMLARAGFDVHFLLRSEFSAVAERGLQAGQRGTRRADIESGAGLFERRRHATCDWLLVGAKTTSNAGFAPAILQAAAPNAKVLLLQNGLDVEDSLRELLPGLAASAGWPVLHLRSSRSPGQIVTHQALGAVHVGYHSGPADEALRAQRSSRRVSGCSAPPVSTPRPWRTCIRRAGRNWSGISLTTACRFCLGRAPHRLMADADSRELIKALMAEVVQGAIACGHDMPAWLCRASVHGHRENAGLLAEHVPRFSAQAPAGTGRRFTPGHWPRPKRLGCEMPRIEALYRS